MSTSSSAIDAPARLRSAPDMDAAARYPLAGPSSAEARAAEDRLLDELQAATPLRRALGYAKLTGPGFLVAANTLGAGTLMGAMLMGAEFGYRTLWVLWLAMGLGLFMLAASARFACRGGFRVIPEQNRLHGVIVGSGLTAMGVACVGVFYNFGQYSLATHVIESLTGRLGFEVPRSVNWIGVMAITSWLTLQYGRADARGTARVERFMQVSVLAMLIGFAACLVAVGVDWPALLRGLTVPWLPRGGEGMTIFIASVSSAIGVMDWILFHYGGLARGWRVRHETLARYDMVLGGFVPFIIINVLIVSLCAETLQGSGARPEQAQDLARALVPLFGEFWAEVFFYLGTVALPISTTVGMSIATAIVIHEAFGWPADTSSLRWKISALLPQIGFLGVWYSRPIWLVIMIGAFLSLTKHFVGWSYYLLLNDPRALGCHTSGSYVWNAGMMLEVTLLNCVSISFVLTLLGLWPE
ncbi:MAG: divalent metal cation transporter [Vicinamibacterales bacterium]